jgi:hypothetical protein
VKTDDDDEWRNASPGAIQRLSLADGNWIEALRYADEKDAADERIAQVEIQGDDTVVLTFTPKPEGEPFEKNVAKYRVSLFRGAATAPAWSRSFDGAGTIDGPSAFSLAGDARYTRSDASGLSFARDHVLVCAGGREDVIALERRGGRAAWRVERVWEFERGFIGPSVWSHFIRRSKEPRAGRIIGGPFAVPFAGPDGERRDDDPNGYRVFVAVGRDAGKVSGYLVEGSVYEINHKGTVLAVTSVPRTTLGSAADVAEDGVVWRCDGGALAKFVPSTQWSGGGMGNPGSDYIARIAWYRQPAEPSVPESWMTTGIAGSPFAMDSAEAWTVLAGAYVRDESVPTFELPITRLDLTNGTETQFVLAVPYAGAVPAPEGNYSKHTIPAERTGTGKARESWTVFGAHALAITDLELDATTLTVRLGGAGGFETFLRFRREALR